MITGIVAVDAPAVKNFRARLVSPDYFVPDGFGRTGGSAALGVAGALMSAGGR